MMPLDPQPLIAHVGAERVVLAEAVRARYRLGGRTPAAVVSPPSPEAVAAILAHAREEGLGVVPWGGGTLQGLGAPPARYDLALSLRAMAEVVDYQPDDLTVTVRPGITPAELERLLVHRNQFLPIDPPRPQEATIGGIVAANASGPLRAGYGTVRDWLIGAIVATPDGHLVKGGGRVVKNVAGYDLPKLWTGALGTLGVLVELTFKVTPRPESREFALAILRDGVRAERLIAAVLDSDANPAVLELCDASAWQAVAGEAPADDGRFVLFGGFFGAEEAAAWQRDLFTAQAEAVGASVAPLPKEEGERLLVALGDFAGDGDLVVRLSVPSSACTETVEAVIADARSRGLAIRCATHAASGSIRARVDRLAPDAVDELVTAWRQAAVARGGHAIVLRAPEAAAGHYDPWGALGGDLRLMREIKRALDPVSVLNPGRFVAGL